MRDRQAAVGVAVVGDPDVRPAGDHDLLELVQMRGADTGVDVEAVGAGPDGLDLGSGPRQRLGGDRVGRAVCAVDDHAQAVEPPGQGGQHVGDVTIGLAVRLAHPADGRAGRPVPLLAEPLLDLVLDRVGQLEAAAREELDPVVRGGVVGGGDHHAHVGSESRRQVSDRRGGQHAEPEDVHAGRRKAGDHRGLQEFS
nr:hypothetical protein GCM10020093_087920 [Planobispora longispora]